MRLDLLVSIFFMASGGLLYEVFLGGFGSYLFGDSVKVFGLVTGCYMFFMGCGAFLVPTSLTQPLKRLLWIEVALVALHLLAPMLIWYAFVEGRSPQAVFFGTLALSGLGVGMEIPLLLGVVRGEEGSSDRRVNQILAADYFGALLASASFGYLLLPYFGMLGTAAVAAAAECVGALVLVAKYRPRGPAKLALLLALISSVGLIAISDRVNHVFEEAWIRKSLPASKILESKWTGFSHLNLVQTEGNGRMLLLDRQVQWITGHDLDFYHEVLSLPGAAAFERASGRRPRRALIIGGGDGLVADRLLNRVGVEEITLIDLDPEVSRLGVSDPVWKAAGGSSLESPKLRHIVADAFSVISAGPQASNTRGGFDLVVIDLPDPAGPGLARFFTPAFFSRLLAWIHPQSLVSIQASYAPTHAYGKLRYVCRMRAALEAVGFKTAALHGDETDHYVLASRSEIQWPAPNARLPGKVIQTGEHVAALRTGTAVEARVSCAGESPSTMLKPSLISI